MLLKTSFFNPTVYKKNLTRFAPVWLGYGLCLVLGLVLMYANGGVNKQYWFAAHMAETIPVMGVVNLGYALLTAQLLFGDLFTGRMCNALHAMPLRREGWFFTHIASGLTFSLVPTAVMAALSLPLLAGSLFDGAWKIAFLFFAAANLQYICFFGIAVFAVMVTGNRFAMAAGYGLINFGAQIVYFLIDTIYTPMLYGVITPYTLAENLTPVIHMTSHDFVKVQSMYDLRQVFGDQLVNATGTFTLTEGWYQLFLCAAAGIAFILAALVLYKLRDLECAGDAVAFRFLVPAFLVPCAIVVAAAAQFFLENFLGVYSYRFLILGFGLVVGWFIGKMLIERSTRVFRLRNWYGLAALIAAIGLSLFLTNIDILGIETSQPDPEDIKLVRFGTDNTPYSNYTDEADIQAILRLQQLALEDRLEDSAKYVLVDGQPVRFTAYTEQQRSAGITQGEAELIPNTQVEISYELESGKLIKRRYNVWTSDEAGDICRELLSRWDILSNNYWYEPADSGYSSVLEQSLAEFDGLEFSCASIARADQYQSIEDAYSLLEALKADADAKLLAQDQWLHKGLFQLKDANAEKGYYETSTIYLYIRGKDTTWGIDVYADSVHTLTWLRERGLLNAEILPKTVARWDYT